MPMNLKKKPFHQSDSVGEKIDRGKRVAFKLPSKQKPEKKELDCQTSRKYYRLFYGRHL